MLLLNASEQVPEGKLKYGAGNCRWRCDDNYKGTMALSAKVSGSHIVKNVISTIGRKEVYEGKVLPPLENTFLLN